MQITVRELAAKGAHVVLSARNMDKGNQAKKDICDAIAPLPCKVDVLQLDLSSLASVKAFADTFKSTSAGGFPRLDMLILNAGVMACPYSETVDGFEMQFGTNHLGHFFLTEQLLPVLEESHARVVVVSSNAHEYGYAEGIRFNQLRSNESYDMGYDFCSFACVIFGVSCFRIRLIFSHEHFPGWHTPRASLPTFSSRTSLPVEPRQPAAA